MKWFLAFSVPVWLCFALPAAFAVNDPRADDLFRAFGYAVFGYPLVAVPSVIFSAIRYRRGDARQAKVAMLVPVVYFSALAAPVLVPTAIALVQDIRYKGGNVVRRGQGLTQFPVEILKDATAVDSLSLSHNRLSSLPPEAGQLTNLRYLGLTDNVFETFPPVICSFQKLINLSLDRNPLKAVPEDIGRLTRLQDLDLSGCQLTTLPESLAHLKSLEILRLSGNPLVTLPLCVTRLTRLRRLELRETTRLTAVPPELKNLTRLQCLDLVGSGVRSVPAELKSMPKLSVLLKPGDTEPRERN
jgi:hypothetical protein